MCCLDIINSIRREIVVQKMHGTSGTAEKYKLQIKSKPGAMHCQHTNHNSDLKKLG